MQDFFCSKFSLFLYLLAITLYTGQGFIFEGTWFTSLSGYYILLLNTFFTYKYFLKKRKNGVLKWMMMFVLWIVIVWLFSPKYVASSYKGEILSTLPMIQYTIVIMTTTFTAMALKQSGALKNSYIYLFYIAVLLLFVMNFFFENSVALYNSTITNNLGYPIVSLMPLTMIFWKKKPIFWLFIFFIFIMSLVSVKRGAILCCITFIMIIGYVYLKEQRTIRFKTVLALCLVGGIIVYIGSHFLSSSDYLLQRLEDTLDGNTSSRDYIVKNIFNRWINVDVFHKLFGCGPIATTSFGNYAHNDWLEVLYDFGLVGLLFYVLFIFGIYFFWVRKRNIPAQCECAFYMVFAYYIIRSTFSMSFYVLETVPVMFAFGYFISESIMQRE